MKIQSSCGRRRVRAGIQALGLAAALLGMATASEARIETIRWTHPDPSSVQGFRLTYVYESVGNTTVVELGVPSPSSGVYRVDVEVPDDKDVFFTMTAYDAQGRESDRSNVLMRQPAGLEPLGRPGRPEVVSP